jgi:hypothetical protein
MLYVVARRALHISQHGIGKFVDQLSNGSSDPFGFHDDLPGAV